ncbi:hypothetical protein ACP70R_024601 [Stipagrostis hirtigluma subsp. patula]
MVRASAAPPWFAPVPPPPRPRSAAGRRAILDPCWGAALGLGSGNEFVEG